MKIFFAAALNAITFSPVAFAILYVLELAGVNFSVAFSGIFLSSAIATALWGKFVGSPVVVFPNYAIIASFLYVEVICRGTPLDTIFAASFFAAVLGILLALLFSRYYEVKINRVFQNIFSSQVLTSSFLFGTAFFLILEGLNLGKLFLPSPFYFAMIGDIENPMAKFSLIGIVILLILYAKNKKFAIITPTVLIFILSYIEGYIAIEEIFAPPIFLLKGFDVDISFTLLRLTFEMLFFMCIIGNFWRYLFDKTLETKSEAKLFPTYISNAISAFFSFFMLLPSPISLVGLSFGNDKKIAYFTALFFLAFIFFESLAKSLMSFSAIYAPALVGAGIFTLLQIKSVPNGSFAEKIAGATFIVIFPLTRDIVTAFVCSIVIYFLLKLIDKK